ncbi:hypothetical protein [Pseudomonas lutea]|jgi:hypothetical protein|uniref:hypothetical protein n=1 Tax=Pseudomonas lutea TaxID=243924 RepID=UPI00069229CC|nr:hypothetical protein [Pseudomonas lutea]
MQPPPSLTLVSSQPGNAPKSGWWVTEKAEIDLRTALGWHETEYKALHEGLLLEMWNGRSGSTAKTPPQRGKSHSMSDITRDELNAKLETIEVKMDARAESVLSKIDGFLAAQAERDKRLDAALTQISKDHGETKASISSMKTTLIVTAVSSVIAIVLGIAGFNTALTSNMMSAFQLGKSEQASSATAQSTPSAKPLSSTPSTPKN